MHTFPNAAPAQLAVTYICVKGHINVRYWRLPCPVHAKVRCTAHTCGESATIPVAERQRHAKLMTGLDAHLVFNGRGIL
jgi:hypothetical protein